MPGAAGGGMVQDFQRRVPVRGAQCAQATLMFLAALLSLIACPGNKWSSYRYTTFGTRYRLRYGLFHMSTDDADYEYGEPGTPNQPDFAGFNQFTTIAVPIGSLVACALFVFSLRRSARFVELEVSVGVVCAVLSSMEARLRSRSRARGVIPLT